MRNHFASFALAVLLLLAGIAIIAAALLSVWILLANVDGAAPPNVRPPRRPPADRMRITRELLPGRIAGKEYAVDCRIVGKSTAFSVPRILVREGEKTMIADVIDLTTAVASDETGDATVTSESWEGTKVTFSIAATEEERPCLDVTAEIRSSGDSAKAQLTEPVTPGGLATVPFSPSGAHLEVIVRARSSVEQ